MDDGDDVGFIEDDEDEVEEEPQKEEAKPSVGTEKEIPPTEPTKVIDLPMTEASDAWMDDGDDVGLIEDDEDEVEVEEEPKQGEAKPSVGTEKEIPSSEPAKII